MNGNHFVGQKVSDFERYNEVGPITGIALLLDSENTIISGDQSGFVMEIECPYGTQAMADNILSSVSGHVYKGFRADNAPLPINAELGDAVTVDGVYSMLAYRSITFGPGHFSEIAAPGENEMDHEYQYQTPIDKINRKIAETRSSITKTAEQIRLEVANELQGLSSSFTVELNSIKGQVTGLDGQVSTLEQTANSITTEISYMEQNISRIDQKVDNIRLEVSNGETSSWISLYAGNVEVSSQKIQFTGDVVFESDLRDGYTTISGDCIRTGEISAEYIKLGGEMIVYEELGTNYIGGFIGYLESQNYNGATTYGMGMLNYNRSYQVVVTDNGARLTSPTAEIVAAVNITLDTSRKINASTEITVTSDRRKKDDIRYDVEKYFPVFDRLKPCSFVRKNGGNQRHLGFIAQEYLDAETSAGIPLSDSVIISETDGYYGISYGEVVPLLVAEVQKLNNRVKELEKWKN